MKGQSLFLFFIFIVFIEQSYGSPFQYYNKWLPNYTQMAPAAAAPKSATDRSKVFFDISIGGVSSGRIVFTLFDDIVPKTVANFKALADTTTYPGMGTQKGGYLNTKFHRIIPNFMIQGGDFTRGDGTGGRSIYGKKFADESFQVKFTKAGQLAMANSGANTNGSQFFITTAVTNWLDGHHVVFGEVSEGMDIVRKMDRAGTSSGKPTQEVKITNCGELIDQPFAFLQRNIKSYRKYPNVQNQIFKQ